MSLKVILRGDLVRARSVVPDAQWLLNKLKTEMSFNNLSQLSRTWPLITGDIVRVQSFFGQDVITIESPFPEVAVVAEEVEIPFIVKFQFEGKHDNKDYEVFWDVIRDELYVLKDADGNEIEQPIRASTREDLSDSLVNGTFIEMEPLNKAAWLGGVRDASEILWEGISEYSGFYEIGVPAGFNRFSLGRSESAYEHNDTIINNIIPPPTLWPDSIVRYSDAAVISVFPLSPSEDTDRLDAALTGPTSEESLCEEKREWSGDLLGVSPLDPIAGYVDPEINVNSTYDAIFREEIKSKYYHEKVELSGGEIQAARHPISVTTEKNLETQYSLVMGRASFSLPNLAEDNIRSSYALKTVDINELIYRYDDFTQSTLIAPLLLIIAYVDSVSGVDRTGNLNIVQEHFLPTSSEDVDEIDLITNEVVVNESFEATQTIIGSGWDRINHPVLDHLEYFSTSEPVWEGTVPVSWTFNHSRGITDKGRAALFEYIKILKFYERPPNGDDYNDNTGVKPTWKTILKLWVQDERPRNLPGNGENKESKYDYQWDEFIEINTEEISSLIIAHPEWDTEHPNEIEASFLERS